MPPGGGEGAQLHLRQDGMRERVKEGVEKERPLQQQVSGSTGSCFLLADFLARELPAAFWAAVSVCVFGCISCSGPQQPEPWHLGGMFPATSMMENKSHIQEGMSGQHRVARGVGKEMSCAGRTGLNCHAWEPLGARLAPLCTSGPLLGAGTDRMLGSSLSVWGPTLGQVHMQVPYGSMHYSEGWRREAMNPGQEQRPSL